MVKYLLEIKNRLILIFMVWFSTILISYFYKETILFSIIQQNIYRTANHQIEIFYFIFTDVREILLVYLKLITFLNLQILCIYFIYHFFLFVIPALFKLEYLYLKWVIKTISLVYFISTIIVIFLLLPLTWKFFLSFQDLTTNFSFYIYFEAKLINFLNFYTHYYYFYILYCQLFTFIFLFLNYIKINTNVIKKYRKLLYYFFLILLIFISPTEIFTQIFIFFLIIVFCESLILLILIKIICNFDYY